MTTKSSLWLTVLSRHWKTFRLCEYFHFLYPDDIMHSVVHIHDCQGHAWGQGHFIWGLSQMSPLSMNQHLFSSTPSIRQNSGTRPFDFPIHDLLMRTDNSPLSAMCFPSFQSGPHTKLPICWVDFSGKQLIHSQTYVPAGEFSHKLRYWILLLDHDPKSCSWKVTAIEDNVNMESNLGPESNHFQSLGQILLSCWF